MTKSIKAESREQLLARNVFKVHVFNFFRWFLLVIAIAVPFFKSRGLNMHEVFQLQTIFAICLLVLEVPSGYLSDMWGRKKTLILGAIFMFIGTFFLLISKGFWSMVPYEIALAISAALISGTDLSLLYDSLPPQTNKNQETKKIIGKNLMMCSVAESIASVLGALIAIISLDWVVAARLAVVTIPFFVALTIVEPEFERMQKKQVVKNLKDILRKLLKDSRELRLVFINNVIWGAATLLSVWCFQHYWENIGIGIIHFGYLWAAYNLTVGFTARIAHRIENFLGLGTVLLSIGILPVIGYIGMGFTSIWLGVLWGFCFQFSRGLNQVIIRDALNVRIESKYRATANSLTSLGVRFMFAVLGPMMGWGFDHSGISIVMYSAAAFFMLAFLFFLLPLALCLDKKN